MKRWAFLVAALYVLVLVVFTLPVVMAAFAPTVGVSEAAGAYANWLYWAGALVMLLCQAALLLVPVQVASQRPVTKRSLLMPVLVAGLMMGGLVIGGTFSIIEFAFADQNNGNWTWWTGIGMGVATWVVWSIAFYRAGRGSEPAGVVVRQCRLLLKGSILELLIAVPTHIVARHRNYCCAGFATFVGLTLGISVMLFSFGPAVFFLFVERWKRVKK